MDDQLVAISAFVAGGLFNAVVGTLVGEFRAGRDDRRLREREAIARKEAERSEAAERARQWKVAELERFRSQLAVVGQVIHNAHQGALGDTDLRQVSIGRSGQRLVDEGIVAELKEVLVHLPLDLMPDGRLSDEYYDLAVSALGAAHDAVDDAMQRVLLEH